VAEPSASTRYMPVSFGDNNGFNPGRVVGWLQEPAIKRSCEPSGDQAICLMWPKSGTAPVNLPEAGFIGNH
jgi:hypothetical protein